jgi:hypothetical protein
MELAQGHPANAGREFGGRRGAMGDREHAKLAAWCTVATHVPRKAWPQSGGLVGEQPGEAWRFAAIGGQSDRVANGAARVHQTENCRCYSGKMTRAANKLDDLMADLAEG